MGQGVKPLLESGKLQGVLDGAGRLTTDTRQLLKEVRAVEPQRAEDALLTIETRVNQFTMRVLVRTGLIGAGWIILFWGGYYLVKRIRPTNGATPGDRKFPTSVTLTSDVATAARGSLRPDRRPWWRVTLRHFLTSEPSDS